MCYIPDLTERYPEGLRTFDEPEECGYEPTYEELVAAGEYKQEEANMKMSFDELNKELRDRGIVYDEDPRDMYETSCYLREIHDWGFIVATSTIVMNDILTFYDWEYQAICSIDREEETEYKITEGVLSVDVHLMFSDGCTHEEFSYNLRDGAPVHICDIASIGVHLESKDDKRFFILKNGVVLYKQDGSPIVTVEKTLDDFIKEGFTIIEPDSYPNNVNILNEEMVRMHAKRY